jgi:hypothetical protein
MITTIEIDCPPERVYAYVTDPTRFPEWQADVVRVEMGDEPGVGARFTTVRRIAGAERSMIQQISERRTGGRRSRSRPDPPGRRHRRGADQWRPSVPRDLHARLRWARPGRRPIAAGPAAGREDGAGQLPPGQGGSRIQLIDIVRDL